MLLEGAIGSLEHLRRTPLLSTVTSPRKLLLGGTEPTHLEHVQAKMEPLNVCLQALHRLVQVLLQSRKPLQHQAKAGDADTQASDTGDGSCRADELQVVKGVLNLLQLSVRVDPLS